MPRPSKAFHLHPNDHAATDLPQLKFDIIAIGSGWAGRQACARLTKSGLSCLLIEDELIGGDCPFWACVPSKVLLRPQEALDTASGIAGAREALQPGKPLDANAVFARRDTFTGGHSDKPLLIPMVESAGVFMARGVGSVAGERKVRITPSNGSPPVIVEALRAVILATGSEPLYPNIKRLSEADPWTPRDATSSSTVPEHLIVVGAGAVGTEMAFAYASFGSKITLIGGGEEIVPSVDPRAGAIVRKALVALGATVKTGSRVVEVSRKDEVVMVKLADGDVFTGTEILLAAGRKPKTQMLNLESAGVSLDQKGYIPVHDNLMVVGTDWLYAGGDVVNRGRLTHTSKYHARIMSNAILTDNKIGEDWSPTNATADRLALPQVIFTHPPLASVGLSMKAAAARNIKVREITAPFASLGSRIASDKAVDGWAQWLVDDHNVLVGATFVGLGADEQLHASTVAVVGGLTLERLAHAIPSFPSLSEVYVNLLDAAGL